MTKIFVFICLLVTLIYAQSNIDAKIKNTNSRLKNFSSNYSTLNKKMADTAKAILEQKQEILTKEKYIGNLTSELKEKESSYNANKLLLQQLSSSQTKLKSQQSKLEDELISTIAKSVSISVILEQKNAKDVQSIMELEILRAMLKKSQHAAKNLNKKFYANSQDIEVLSAQASSLKDSIDDIDQKRKDLIATQKSNKKLLAQLQRSKNSYKNSLKELLAKQDSLKKTLAKLNIIKIDQLKKAQQEKERQEAFASQQNLSDAKLPKVKKHGSSYQSVKTKKYYGHKTIAPLDAYTITKKYGTYTDPIYGIKVFNESISMKPKEVNAKVKTVLNGKVIYADNTAVLDNIVIVEHKNGLHTIYANLSQISPNIKQGKRIKKGYTIGRVKDELIFEVTQKSYHINPISLIN